MIVAHLNSTKHKKNKQALEETKEGNTVQRKKDLSLFSGTK